MVDGHRAEVGDEVELVALEAQARRRRRLRGLFAPHRLECAAHAKMDVEDRVRGRGLVAGAALVLRLWCGDGLRGATAAGPREEVEEVLTMNLRRGGASVSTASGPSVKWQAQECT